MNKSTGTGFLLLILSLLIASVRIFTLDTSHNDLLDAYARILENRIPILSENLNNQSDDEPISRDQIHEILRIMVGKINLRYATSNALEPLLVFFGVILLAIGHFQSRNQKSTIPASELVGAGRRCANRK